MKKPTGSAPPAEFLPHLPSNGSGKRASGEKMENK